MEEKIAHYMKKYGISREEAIEMIEYDTETDNMKVSEIKKELTPEQREAQKAMTITTSGKKVERKREHKINERKKWFIDVIKTLFEGFLDLGKIEKMEVSNAERTIEVFADGKHYTITLTEHRQPKN